MPARTTPIRKTAKKKPAPAPALIPAPTSVERTRNGLPTARYASILGFLFLALLVSLLFAGCTPQDADINDAHVSSSSSISSISSISFDSSVSSASSVSVSASPSTASVSSLPSTVSLPVPFASQAPFGNWDPPYDEACEEASLILAKAYLDGKTSITPTEMDKQILDLVAWETQQGLPIDITAEQLAHVARDRFGLSARTVENPSVEDIKRELAAGNPVILPLAGRDIGNPYYSGEGPWYHVLVVTGYDARNFITMDVGTKRGEGYEYRYDVLHSAIHDWTGIKEEIRQGKRIMVVVEAS